MPWASSQALQDVISGGPRQNNKFITKLSQSLLILITKQLRGLLRAELCLPQILKLDSYTPVHQNVTVFGEEAFKEVIKVKRGYKGEALAQYDWCPYKRRKFRHRYVCAQRRTTEDTGKRCYPPAKETWQGDQASWHLDLGLPGLWSCEKQRSLVRATPSVLFCNGSPANEYKGLFRQRGQVFCT